MVTKRVIQRIREAILCQHYDMTVHAMEEMAEDDLDINDIEHAVINGKIVHTDSDDPRGAKYVIHGKVVNPNIPVGVVGRFATNDRFLIITVFEITD